MSIAVLAPPSPDEEPTEFVWPPELIAEVAADMDRGIALLAQRRYDTIRRCWVSVSRPRVEVA